MTDSKPPNDARPPKKSSSFADLASEIDGLEPLESGPRSAPPPGETRPRDPARPGRGASPGAGPAEPLHFPDPDQPLLGRRSWLRDRELRRLRQGQIPVDLTLDLHGEDLASARRRVIDQLAASAEAGHACVLIVHGKGHHSRGGVARLRDALPAWLDDPALAGAVVACAPAIPEHGGFGAVYVLLA